MASESIAHSAAIDSEPIRPRGIIVNVDRLDVSTDGVDIPLLLNFLDIFAESILVSLSLLQLWEWTPLSFKRLHLLTL